MAKATKVTANKGSTAKTAAARAASRREERRLLHQDLSRSQLLDAAEEVFGDKGFHETTLKEIAELAEFSVGSVYSFFENKDDLYLSVFLRRGEEFLPAMEAVVNRDATPLEQLHQLVEVQVGFFREHPHFGRLYLRSASAVIPILEVAASAQLSENFERAMALQADIFARGQKDEQIRDGDPVVLARLFSGLISAYQSLDPAVVGDERPVSEPLALEALHDIIDGAFARH
jgi:TetR/AcrR family transcriptional regulator